MKKIAVILILLISCSPSKRVNRDERTHDKKMHELDSILNVILSDSTKKSSF